MNPVDPFTPSFPLLRPSTLKVRGCEYLGCKRLERGRSRIFDIAGDSALKNAVIKGVRRLFEHLRTIARIAVRHKSLFDTFGRHLFIGEIRLTNGRADNRRHLRERQRSLPE